MSKESDKLLNSRYSNRVYAGAPTLSYNYKSSAAATAHSTIQLAASKGISNTANGDSVANENLSSYSKQNNMNTNTTNNNTIINSGQVASTNTYQNTATNSNSTNNLPKIDIKPLPVEEDKGSTLVIAFVLMLFFQLGNRIFGRLQTYPMHNYPIFMNMLSVFIYVPISFAYIIPMIRYTNVISKEQQEIPKYKFAIMGVYDSLAGIMQTFAVNYITNSSTIVLVQQSAIPISMIISKITLKAQYTNAQYLGAFVVLLGIVVVLIPTFSGNSSTDSNSIVELIWIAVLVVSCVPMCLSSVYKEKALGETEIDVVYLNGWVAVFQFLFAIPLCIPSSQVINIPLSGILPNLYGGALCWMGIDTITEQTGGQNADDCSSAPLFVNLYLCFNVVYNILIIVILKHGSANILWMASTVIVPLSNVAFSLKFMPGHTELTKWDLIGLIVIMIGLVLYRFMSQLISLWNMLTGNSTVEDEALLKKARLVEKKAEGKQTKFIGINQIEGIETLFDTRVWREQKKSLFRSPQQIRGSLLLRLGIPPSPLISIGPPSRDRKFKDLALSPVNSLNRNLPQSTKNAGYQPLKPKAAEV